MKIDKEELYVLGFSVITYIIMHITYLLLIKFNSIILILIVTMLIEFPIAIYIFSKLFLRK